MSLVRFKRGSRNDSSKVARPSLFIPGHNCQSVARAARAALLIDGEAYFKAFARAALRATRSIVIVGWDFHSRTRLHLEQEGIPDLLGDFLNFLVKRRRGLDVYVLTWDYPMVFAKGREASPAYGLGWRPHRRVHFRYDDHCPLGAALHQKIVVIDGALAFCGGLDLTASRWDTPEHRSNDPRRTNSGEAEPYAPFHDAMLAVDSEAARALHDLVNERWNRATGKHLPRTAARADPWPAELPVMCSNVDVAVARTVAPLDGESAVAEVQALYLDMIAAAKRYIYLENQYFTSKALGDALAARLAEPDGPEIIAVLRLSTAGWLEAPTMGTLRTVLLRKLREADRYGRFHPYYQHLPGLSGEQCCDLHTKLMIVDDEWLRVGSANFANRSMGLDTECDLAMEARGDPQIQTAIAHARDRFLGEHLDVPPESVPQAIRETGSVGDAIASLARPEGRTLKGYEKLDEPSAALLAVASGVDPERPVSLDQMIADFASDTGSRSARPGRRAVGAIVLALIGIAAMWHYTPLAGLADADRIIARAQALADQPWVPLFVLAAYTPATLFLFPRPLITLFAVVAFGPWLGFIYALSGILIAALLTYAMGRRLDRSVVRRIAGRRLMRLSKLMYQRGLLAMAALRLVPLAPSLAVNIVAGAIGIRPGHFLLGTALGVLPGTVVATVFAHQLVTGLHDPRSINVWLIVMMLGAMAAAGWTVRRRIFGSTSDEHGAGRP
jgi:phosphatidylserine/phosphatidylglycerophosphate/cardiolipin synthase-like enzyme/uncharacterized membrane protein YdjX (TVP38/TMEM64 family)